MAATVCCSLSVYSQVWVSPRRTCPSEVAMSIHDDEKSCRMEGCCNTVMIIEIMESVYMMLQGFIQRGGCTGSEFSSPRNLKMMMS